MSAALIVLVLTVAKPPGDGGAASAMLRPTVDALGPNAEVVIRTVNSLPPDAEALALASAAHADVIAEISWAGPDQARAKLRMQRARGAPWIERELAFRANDEPRERTRTVALALVSMLEAPQTADEQRAAQRTPAQERPSTTTEPSAQNEATVPDMSLSGGRTPEHANLLSAGAVGTIGMNDDGGGLGGTLDYRHRVAERVFLRGTGGARAGEATAAQAVIRSFYAGIGLAWSAFVSANARASLGLRLDALVMMTSFGHLSSDDPETVHQYKWLPGADALVEGSYFFASGTAVFAGAGAEAMMGKTDIFVRGVQVTSVRPMHPVFELGLRAGF